jgi:hypothetical protein
MPDTPHQLLPCPAGHDDIATNYDDEFEAYTIECERDECKWRTWGNTPDEAITAWNTRADTRSPANPEQDWQPIETAPKDGAPFLAYTISRGPGDPAPRYRVEIAHWTGSYHYAHWGCPTHWQPLPELPAAIAALGVSP